MSTTVEGVYQNGKIELSETLSDVCDGARVFVTFLPPGSINLREHGIDKAQAANLRARFACFAEDWESPEMSIYDNYDEKKAKLENNDEF